MPEEREGVKKREVVATLLCKLSWRDAQNRGSFRVGVRCFDILLESACGEVIFLSTAVGCFHPCQTVITQRVLHRRV
jgi:hypothetical protein